MANPLVPRFVNVLSAPGLISIKDLLTPRIFVSLCLCGNAFTPSSRTQFPIMGPDRIIMLPHTCVLIGE